MAIRHWNDFDDIRGDVMTWIVALLIGWLCGWWHAHSVVATECQKLGKFYVGDTVYECQAIRAKEKPGA
ncbi:MULTISPECIES: hypothetical protein [unclassified Pseudomonas]|uniref:hypothetical protein n=1 Tax=unclassified Pseudomonas TaxID=196821 RepID=UPI00244A57CB|nr:MULTISPECIES: hypothetical protein [unclassified Pseudomonas]MDG9928279.1 hypothetical protein [Pseudomonas sp. GD04042]MDH0481157.1 hypothetical protein [Pseudomonas sp. GD04015]MDH0604493.1 hypothetical protein [Pseudomonas sp. GD03869]